MIIINGSLLLGDLDNCLIYQFPSKGDTGSKFVFKNKICIEAESNIDLQVLTTWYMLEKSILEDEKGRYRHDCIILSVKSKAFSIVSGCRRDRWSGLPVTLYRPASLLLDYKRDPDFYL